MKIDQLIRSKRKTVALIVEPDGRLVVRAPLHAPLARLQELVEQKSSWILRKRAEANQASEPPAPHQFVPGELFYYLGKAYPLEILPRSRTPLVLKDRFYMARSAQPRAREVFAGWYLLQAAGVLNERVAEYASRTGLTHQRIRITSARARWGSCSPRGTLSFSWRLVMAPMPVIDYVVVHELAHLVEKNHSSSFWELVNAILSDTKARRLWLKTHGSQLSLD